MAQGHRMRNHDLSHRRSLDLSPETVASFDAVVVVTDHRAFDWPMIADNAQLVVDTRNALEPLMAGRPNYFKA